MKQEQPQSSQDKQENQDLNYGRSADTYPQHGDTTSYFDYDESDFACFELGYN